MENQKKTRERIEVLYFQREFNQLRGQKELGNKKAMDKIIENRKRIEQKIREEKKNHAHFIKMYKKIKNKKNPARYNYIKFGEISE